MADGEMFSVFRSSLRYRLTCTCCSSGRILRAHAWFSLYGKYSASMRLYLRYRVKIVFGAVAIFIVFLNLKRSLDTELESADEWQDFSAQIDQQIPQTLLAEDNTNYGVERNSKTTAVLVIACDRPVFVKRCLDMLLKHSPSKQQFEVIVSQDCGDHKTRDAINTYGNQVQFIMQPDLSDIDVPEAMKGLEKYYKISRHYKWALTQVFDVMRYESVIIVQDNTEISPDFFEYYKATLPLLDKDPTLWCISAWNDNGKVGFSLGNDILYRTDFFLTNGWALKYSLWDELKEDWPESFWEDWMMLPRQRKGHACIRPEIPRTKLFDDITNNEPIYGETMKHIQLNNKYVHFTKKKLDYLMKSNFDPGFEKKVYQESQLVSIADLVQRKVSAPSVRIEYGSSKDFLAAALELDIVGDIRAGVPRMAYRGVVTFMFEGTRVFLAPPKGFEGYDEEGEHHIH